MALYAPPAVPAGRDVVVIEGGGTTVSEAAENSPLSATDVATTWTERFAITGLGAVYVVEVGVWFESVPQAVPTHPLPDKVQVTPLPDVSLTTMAVIVANLPSSTACAEEVTLT